MSLLHDCVGMLSNMRNCNRLSETFDDEQFFNNDVDFDQTSNPTGEVEKNFVRCLFCVFCTRKFDVRIFSSAEIEFDLFSRFFKAQ